MPSPIMLPPTPDLHPIRQELLRGLVRAIRMSKRQCRDMALKIAAPAAGLRSSSGRFWCGRAMRKLPLDASARPFIGSSIMPRLRLSDLPIHRRIAE